MQLSICGSYADATDRAVFSAAVNKSGLSIGIIGGIGLGLMLGSEFSGRYIVILGAILIVISLISMAILSIKVKK